MSTGADRPPPSVGPERPRRLFFALWPDAALRAALATRLAALLPPGAGRAQSPRQWHVTLEFLGSVPPGRLAAACDAAEGVRCGPFELAFDAVEHWRRPQVLCLVARVPPAPLAMLVARLRHGLAEQGFVPEDRAYRAHLTVARKVSRPVAVPPFEPIPWPARDFALVESVSDAAGPRYGPLRHWVLQG